MKQFFPCYVPGSFGTAFWSVKDTAATAASDAKVNACMEKSQ